MVGITLPTDLLSRETDVGAIWLAGWFGAHGDTNTGLFISPSGISDPCGTVVEMVTPKGSMSTEEETLQVSVLPYRCSIC